MMVVTVLTVYGIETLKKSWAPTSRKSSHVVTVLTVYGIETLRHSTRLLHQASCNSTYRLRY